MKMFIDVDDSLFEELDNERRLEEVVQAVNILTLNKTQVIDNVLNEYLISTLFFLWFRVLQSY